ncbi:hypothetical protein EF808_01755, partial [archaeon]
MACNMSSCNQRQYDRAIRAAEEGLPYSRKDLMDDLYLNGGSAVYAVAPELIPKGLRTVTTPYGETYKVLRLRRKGCPDDGTTMEHFDWAGVEPGVYVESKAWLIVEVLGDGPITERESRAPRSRTASLQPRTRETSGSIPRRDSMADAKYWNGSGWVSVPSIKHWDGASWADVKRVLQWDGASWDEVWSAASPPESPLYLYEDGTEHVSWVQGDSDSPYIYTEASTYIYLRADKIFYNNGGYVNAQTENPVDVTDYNTVYMTY